MSYDRYDVILVLFPFTEKRGLKQRPSIVLSDRQFNDAHRHAIVAMVTTATHTAWPSDIRISDFNEAGLLSPSVARAKLFTVSLDLVPGRVGTLSQVDQASMQSWISSLVAAKIA